MAKAQVVGGPSGGAGQAAAGEFSKAFATILDAMNTAKQVNAVMAGVQQQQRQADMTAMLDFMQNMVKDLSPVMEGGTKTVYEKLRPNAVMFWEKLGVPAEQTNKMFDELISAPESLAMTAQRDISEAARNAGETPQESVAAPAEDLSKAPSHDDDPWSRRVIGPDTDAKRAKIREAGDAALGAISTQDFDNPASVKAATDRLRAVSGASEAGATSAQKSSRLDNPKVQEFYKSALGENWKGILAYSGLGVLPDFLRAEANKEALKALSPLDQARADEIRQKVEYGEKAGMPYDLAADLTVQGAVERTRLAIEGEQSKQKEAAALNTNIRNIQTRLTTLQNEFTKNGQLDEKGFRKSPMYIELMTQLAETQNALAAMDPANKSYYKLQFEDVDNYKWWQVLKLLPPAGGKERIPRGVVPESAPDVYKPPEATVERTAPVSQEEDEMDALMRALAPSTVPKSRFTKP